MATPRFKQPTVANWKEPDPVGRYFVKLSRATGEPLRMEGDDWAALFLPPGLSATVPLHVAQLFEVARGCALYGFFFYPLYALALEKLWRAADVACSARFQADGGPQSIRTFEGRINWLRDHGAFDAASAEQWHATRRRRNSASHPEFQQLALPGEVANLVRVVALQISALF